ncbi:MAG TPA: prepilin peptidase [Thermoanaerobaculia bacterium]|nr:prepilin peptidase [Thermoanaerobaculia bacterium]
MLLGFYAFAMGAIVGSFLNVVIHRWPREESIVFPGSHCPHCNAPIRWFDNIPVLSWLVLRGRCRRCRQGIAVRYPLVELANALFWLGIYLRVGISIDFLPLAAIVSMTIVLIWIDLDVQLLPDVVNYPGIAIGLGVGALGMGNRYPDLMLSRSLIDSAIGIAAGAGVLLAVALAYKLVRKTEGMGLGDVKMLAMIGAVSGIRAILPVMLIASTTGAIAGVLLAVTQKRDYRFALPFGVFLGLAFLAVIFFASPLLDWYFGLLVSS